MKLEDAKLVIEVAFINRYKEWLQDRNNMEEREYSRKYGWCKTSEPVKDTQKTMLYFQSHIFKGEYIWNWKKYLIDQYMVYELTRDGFLSYDNLWSSRARRNVKTDFYYINQELAKVFFKNYKNGELI